MDRRAFLRALLSGAAGAVAAHTLDLDRLLWMPGARTIFLPPVETFELDPLAAIYTREALRILQNNLTFASMINRPYDARGMQAGATIRIRKPARYAA